MSDMTQSLTDAKAACKKGTVAGLRFVVTPNENKHIPAGSQVEGVVLAELSPAALGSGGKVQAELTCTVAGCTEKHIRQISDWHQVYKCRTHAKAKGKLTDAEKIARAEARLAEMKAAAAQ